MNNLANNIVGNDKMFYIYSSELEGRLDPFYYKPSLRELERKVRQKSTKKLRNFIIKVSSGATPSVNEEEKYYSGEENGIPFLRVQNLQINGKINLTDVKYINKETHEGLLKRSQVAEGDLLVKITGVGRMAIASVAPESFVGNTNQHMVVIKTDSRNTSEYLSSYLNLDFVERIASRRATGGTRPALDYPALKSIPIIEGIDFTEIVEAEEKKAQKESEAKILLDSIDEYLLNELGILMPKRDNSLQSRIFITQFKDITGGRFDPKGYDRYIIELKYAIKNNTNKNYIAKPLAEFVIQSIAGNWGIDESETHKIKEENFEKCLVIRATEFDNDYNLNLENLRVKYRYIRKDKLRLIDAQKDDLLIEKSGGSIDQPVGRISILKSDILKDRNICYSNFVHKIRIDNRHINPLYLFCFLKTIHNIKLTETMQSQTNGIRNLIMSEYLHQHIVLPIKSTGEIDIEKQDQIAQHIQSIRDKAKQLQEEAERILCQAKTNLQNTLLNK